MPLANKGEHRLCVPAKEDRTAIHFKQVMRDEKDRREVDYPQRRCKRRISRPPSMSDLEKEASEPDCRYLPASPNLPNLNISAMRMLLRIHRLPPTGAWRTLYIPT
jgi:Flp pilus assembly protein TadB